MDQDARRFLRKAQHHAKAGRLPQAEQAIEAALDLSPQDTRLLLTKLQILRQGPDPDAASRFIRGLSLKSATRKDLVQKFVGHLLRHGDVDHARAILDQAEALNRRSEEYWIAHILFQRHQGGPSAALGVAVQALAARPGSLVLAEWLVRLHNSAGTAEAAVDALRTALARKWSDDIALLLANRLLALEAADAAIDLYRQVPEPARNTVAWQLLLSRAWARLDRMDEAIGLLRAALDETPDSAPLFDAFWTLSRRAGDPEATEEFLRTRLVPRLGASRDAVEIGHRMIETRQAELADQLIAHLDGLAEGVPLRTKLVVLQARRAMLDHDYSAARALLDPLDPGADRARHQQLLGECDFAEGRVGAGLDRLHRLADTAPQDHDLALQLAKWLVEAGRIGDARDRLTVLAEQSKGPVRARVDEVLALLAMERGAFAEAMTHVDAALAQNDTSSRLKQKAICLIFLGRSDEAYRVLTRAAEKDSLAKRASRASRKASQTYHGQIVNEFRLLGADTALAPPTAAAPGSAAELKARAEQQPDNAALAMLQLWQQRLEGHLDTPGPSNAPGHGIPRQLFFFWDSEEIPPALQANIDRNREINPELDVLVFDERQAQQMMQEKGEMAAFRAFRRAPHAAAKSDIFRLARLYHHGGIYMDADDLCLEPLSAWLDLSASFVGYQEKYMSIGNNFIAVAPRNPVIRAALDFASEAYMQGDGESVWLATGPGCLSRALVAKGTDAQGRLAPGQVILTRAQKARHIFQHMPMPYKTGAGHWVRQLNAVAS